VLRPSAPRGDERTLCQLPREAINEVMVFAPISGFVLSLEGIAEPLAGLAAAVGMAIAFIAMLLAARWLDSRFSRGRRRNSRQSLPAAAIRGFARANSMDSAPWQTLGFWQQQLPAWATRPGAR